MITMIGKKFGNLTVIKQLESKALGEKKKKIRNWLCKCKCGAICEKTTHLLKYTKSCGCLQKERMQKIYPGDKFAYLTALELITGSSKWKCKCFCGRYIMVLSTNLLRKKTKSCGCMSSAIRNDTYYANKKHEL